MAFLTRRGFLGRASVGIATLGMLIGVPGMAAVADSSEAAPAADLSAVEFSEPMVARISNLATGELSLLVGTREIFYKDADLVLRLVQAAK